MPFLNQTEPYTQITNSVCGFSLGGTVDLSFLSRNLRGSLSYNSKDKFKCINYFFLKHRGIICQVFASGKVNMPGAKNPKVARKLGMKLARKIGEAYDSRGIVIEFKDFKVSNVSGVYSSPTKVNPYKFVDAKCKFPEHFRECNYEPELFTGIVCEIPKNNEWGVENMGNWNLKANIFSRAVKPIKRRGKEEMPWTKKEAVHSIITISGISGVEEVKTIEQLFMDIGNKIIAKIGEPVLDALLDSSS